MQLSLRLKAIADLVTPGNRLVDVGCDHGYLPVYLVQENIIPSAIAMDVRKGPLERARENIRMYGYEAFIKTRLSDGLKELGIGEGETLVIAGMGGPLMESILSAKPEVREGFREMILQPQSDIRHFRVFLQEIGWTIVQEAIVVEDGKYYPMMKLHKHPEGMQNHAGDALREPEYAPEEEWFGRLLLKRQDPILLELIRKENRIRASILRQLEQQQSETARKRIAEVKEEKQIIEAALKHYESI